MLRAAYRDRALFLSRRLAEAPRCRVTAPEGGMFVLLDVSGTARSARDFAHSLLHQEDVAILPCDGFGPSAAGQLRVSLTAPEDRLDAAATRIVRFARSLAG